MTTTPALTAVLDELDELRAKATPGRWERDGEYPAEVYNGACGHAERLVAECHNMQDSRALADAALIVAAVNRLPELTAALRAVLELADELDATVLELGRLGDLKRTADRRRAALASPAPAPQGGGQR